MTNHLVWVDIPVLDLERAATFYSNVLEVEMRRDIPEMPMVVFDHQKPAVSGCLFVSEENRPSATGPLIYLNVDGRLRAAVAAAEKHGGKVVDPIEPIGPFGYRAVIVDTEGNRVALHSQRDS